MAVDRFGLSWLAFRQAWLRDLAKPLGLLSPIALHWLDERWQRMDGVPGEWRAAGPGAVAVRAERSAGLVVGGREVDGEVVLSGLAAGAPPVTHGGLVLVPLLFPAQTGQPERLGVQVRSGAATADRLRFGIPTFAPDPRWALPARFEPYAEPRPVTLHSIVNQMVKNLAVFGRVVFEHAGAEHALEVYAGPRHELHIPFRDRTSGITTFAGSRLVFAPRPEAARGGGFDLVLDFNRAVNGPCGLTQCTTCALPPPGNTLPFAVEAGEKIPLWMPQPGDWAR